MYIYFSLILGQSNTHFRALGSDHILGKQMTMQYKNFEGALSDLYGIKLEGWPLTWFLNQSDLTMSELDILHNMWKDGRTKFMKVTKKRLQPEDREDDDEQEQATARLNQSPIVNLIDNMNPSAACASAPSPHASTSAPPAKKAHMSTTEKENVPPTSSRCQEWWSAGMSRDQAKLTKDQARAAGFGKAVQKYLDSVSRSVR